MKKILIFICSLFLMSHAFSAQKHIQLTIQFDSAANPQSYNQILHVRKRMQLDPNQTTNQIVMAQSTVVDNFPITVALLVKPLAVNKDDVKLQFNLVNYGYSRGETLISQPTFVLRKNQSAKLKAGPYQLRVSANWQ